MEVLVTPEDIKNITETIKMLGEFMETKPNEWLPVYAALGGAIAGAVASFFPTLLLERRRERKFSRRILSSLIAEISALLEIAEYRGYHKAIEEAIESLKTQPEGSTQIFKVDVPEHYSRIYQENCINIGAVDERYAKDIVIFHQLIDAVIQDVKLESNEYLSMTLRAYEEMNKILTRAIEIGEKLVNAYNKQILVDQQQEKTKNIQ